MIDNHIKEWQRFNNLEHQVIDAFLHEYFLSKNEVEKDFIAIGFRVIVDVINSIHFYNKKQKKGSLNLPIVDFKPIISYKDEFKKHTLSYRTILSVKAFININRFRLRQIFKKPKRVVQESFNLGHLKEYDDAGLLFPISIYGKIIKNRNSSLTSNNSFIKSLSNAIVDKIIDNITSSKLDYLLQKEEISKLIENHFNEFSDDYFNLKESKNLKSVLFSTGNKTAVRLYVRLCLNNNKKVEAFAHGHNLQNKDKHKLWMDLIISNTYYEQSESLKNEIKEYIENLSDFKKLHKINFEFINKYPSSPQKKADFTLDIKKIDKVLIIGNATKSHAFSSVTAFEIDTQIIIEEAIFNYFKSQDKKVYYKPHPGGHLKKQLLSHYLKIDDLKFENEPFESILNDYDLIVFYYTRTSTITAALNCDKPILLFDLGIEEHCSESRAFLESRCFIKQLN